MLSKHDTAPEICKDDLPSFNFDETQKLDLCASSSGNIHVYFFPTAVVRALAFHQLVSRVRFPDPASYVG